MTRSINFPVYRASPLRKAPLSERLLNFVIYYCSKFVTVIVKMSQWKLIFQRNFNTWFSAALWAYNNVIPRNLVEIDQLCTNIKGQQWIIPKSSSRCSVSHYLSLLKWFLSMNFSPRLLISQDLRLLGLTDVYFNAYLRA